MGMVEVDVKCKYDDNGVLVPYRVCWEDGRFWNITRVVHTCSSEIDFEGIRYTVKIGRAAKYIFRVHNRWYVDRVP